MTRLIRLLLASTLAFGLLGIPAAAEEEPDCYAHDYDEDGNPIGPEFCTLQAWFKAGEVPVGNIAGAADLGVPTWDTTPPGDFTDATGGLTAAPGLGSARAFEPAASAVFSGDYTGPVDTMAVELYGFFLGLENVGAGDIWIVVQVELDGVTIGRQSSEQIIPVEAIDASYGVIRFVLDGVDDEMKFEGLDRGQDAEHEITISISPFDVPFDDAIFVYGVDEGPSNITFNIQEGKNAYTALPLW